LIYRAAEADESFTYTFQHKNQILVSAMQRFIPPKRVEIKNQFAGKCGFGKRKAASWFSFTAMPGQVWIVIHEDILKI
jgi:hypothetical protein